MSYGKPPTQAQVDKLIEQVNRAMLANQAWFDTAVAGAEPPPLVDEMYEASYVVCHLVQDLLNNYLIPKVQGLVE